MDAQWAVLEPLVLAVRPCGKTPHGGHAAHDGGDHLAAPERGGVACGPGRAWDVVGCGADVHPLGQAGVWERLLALAQERAGGIELGMAFLDGTNVRAHAKAAGAPKKGGPDPNGTCVKRLGALVAALAPR